MDRNYFKCANAKEAAAKVEMILLPGNSHYYWCDVRCLTYYYGPEMVTDAEKEYEYQLGRFNTGFESITHYEKDEKGKWKIINKKTI